MCGFMEDDLRKDRLQAHFGGGPGGVVDQGGDTPAGGVLEPEKVVDEGVQEMVVVTEEDADGEEPGGAEDGADAVGGGDVGPHHIESVPEVPGVGGLAVARVIRLPIGIVAAGTGVWR